jgi:sulfur carrier protein ThiS
VRVSVSLVGILQEYYPGAIDTEHGPVVQEAAPGTTVRAFISALGVPDELEYFIMVNGERVDQAAAQARALEDNDDVVLVPVLKGG